MFKSILVLCIGNICRSPLAHVQLQAGLKALNIPIKITSAGLGALHDHPAHETMRMIAEDQGINLDDHRAQQVSPTLMQQADLVLVMTENQKDQVHREYPQSRGKVFLLLNQPPQDIPDPYGKSLDDFDIAAELIRKGVDQWLQTLSK